MFEHDPNLKARGFMIAACLAPLAGCGEGAQVFRRPAQRRRRQNPRRPAHLHWHR